VQNTADVFDPVKQAAVQYTVVCFTGLFDRHLDVVKCIAVAAAAAARKWPGEGVGMCRRSQALQPTR